MISKIETWSYLLRVLLFLERKYRQRCHRYQQNNKQSNRPHHNDPIHKHIHLHIEIVRLLFTAHLHKLIVPQHDDRVHPQPHMQDNEHAHKHSLHCVGHLLVNGMDDDQADGFQEHLAG